MTDREDVICRVYVHVRQLVENPPRWIYEAEIDRYNELLDRLDGVGFRTDEFRFDLSRDTFLHATNRRRMMRPDIFLRQVKALALYFEVRDKLVVFDGPKQEP